jgi:hypothetical protein
MRRLVLVWLFAVATALYGQSPSCPKSGCATGSATVTTGDITDLGAGVAAWLQTASCANFATAVSGETGTCGSIVLSVGPTLTGPIFDNAATSGGYFRLPEDTDNGSNYVQISAPDSMAANTTITLAAPRFSQANVELNTGGPNLISTYDEFNCGVTTSGSNNFGSCTGIAFQQAAGTCTIGAIGLTGVGGVIDADRIGIASISCDAVSDAAVLRGNQTGQMRLTDKARIRFAVFFEDLIASGSQEYLFYGGFGDAPNTDATGPTDGAYAFYSVADTNWQIVTIDGGSGDTSSCSNVAVAADTWYDWDIWYESGVGVHFIVNGTECTNSPMNGSNLPTASGEEFSTYMFKMNKTVGATARVTYLDYFRTDVPVTRP